MNKGDNAYKTRRNLFAARSIFVLMLAPDVTGADEDFLYQLKYIPYKNSLFALFILNQNWCYLKEHFFFTLLCDEHARQLLSLASLDFQITFFQASTVYFIAKKNYS